MFKEPKLTDLQCAEICKGMDLTLFNARAHNGNKLTMKLDRTIIDTIYSFEESDPYTQIVNKLSGDVLILGLGFGYSILFACASDKVKSVKVIELHQEVIEVFKAIHGDKFKGSEKLTIINQDAIEYTSKGFDHVFIDCIHDVKNKTKYVDFMEQLKEKYIDSKIHYINLL